MTGGVALPSKPAPARLQAKGNEEPCIVCGRKVDLARAGSIHYVASAGVVPVSDTTDYGMADQGWYSIGPECARLLPKGYVQAAAS